MKTHTKDMSSIYLNFSKCCYTFKSVKPPQRSFDVLETSPFSEDTLLPAWVVIVNSNGTITPTPGVIDLKAGKKVVIEPVPSPWRPWCKAGLILARSKFGPTIDRDRTQANARIAFWINGGIHHAKGWIKDKMEVDDLPLRILQQWPAWQSPQFQGNKLKLWSARLDSIKQAGYQLALNENRLEVTFQRMGFKIDKPKLQKKKKM